MAVGSIVARILTQYSDKGSKAASKDVMKLGKSFDKFAKKSAKAFGIAAAASAAFAIKIGKDAVDAAIQDQKSQMLLANSLRNTVGATDSAIAGTEVYVTAMQKQFSVVDDELRPALAALAAATGSVTSAQSLMQTALDVSANSGVDLGTAVKAIIAGTRGQYRALAKLVPGLDATTLATKDYGIILDKVSKLTAGAAATRAGTLEYRLAGLKIAFGEILESLGYALLPIMEKFAKTISTKILPQLEAFISANKDRLAASFAIAAEFAVKFLGVAVAFGNWVANNTELVKTLAVIILTMFAAGKVYTFIAAINKLTAAFVAQKGAAAAAAAASAAATGTSATGAAKAVGKKNPLVGVAAFLGALFLGNSLEDKALDYLVEKFPNSAEGKRRRAAALADRIANNPAGRFYAGGSGGSGGNVGSFSDSPISGPGSDLQKYLASLGKTMNTTAKASKALLTEKQKELNLKLKELGIVTTEQQDAITQMAILKNAERQKAISKSATIAAGNSGSLKSVYGNNTSIYVAGSVSTEQDLITAINDGQQRTTRRSFGNGGRFAPVIK
jgi:hypothetical protein